MEKINKARKKKKTGTVGVRVCPLAEWEGAPQNQAEWWQFPHVTVTTLRHGGPAPPLRFALCFLSENFRIRTVAVTPGTSPLEQPAHTFCLMVEVVSGLIHSEERVCGWEEKDPDRTPIHDGGFPFRRCIGRIGTKKRQINKTNKKQ